MTTIRISIPPADMAKVVALANFGPIFEGQLWLAGYDSLQELQDAATAVMWAQFKNPMGQLEDSLQKQMLTPYVGEMGSPLPYSARRNWGFSGMTDSLGRYYASDPGIEYMEITIAVSTQPIMYRYAMGVGEAFRLVGAI